MSKNGVIGKDSSLPWHFSSDLKNFKALTTGQTVLMGRKTFESIGKPLPNRENFVLTRHPRTAADGARFFGSINEALKQCKTEHCFIIGGSDLFNQTLSLVDGVYMTFIDEEYDGDAFYPEVPDFFVERSRRKLQENPVLEFIFYEKENVSKGLAPRQ